MTVDPTTGQLATEYCPYRVTEIFPDWAVPNEICQRHSPGGNDQTADLSLGQPLIDPETGLPIDPSDTEEPRYAITDDGLQITDPGGDRPIVISPARTFPPHPVAMPASGGAAGGADDENGMILIRPTARPSPAGARESARLAGAGRTGGDGAGVRRDPRRQPGDRQEPGAGRAGGGGAGGG